MRTADSLTRSRLARWEELELLVAQAGGRLRRLRGVQVERLGVLYRSATSDLAVARRDFPADPVAAYLQRLIARTHPILFRDREPLGTEVARMLVRGFPRAVRALAAAHLAAGLAFLGAAAAALVSGLLFADALRSYVPSVIMERVRLAGEAVRDRGAAEWMESPLWLDSAPGWDIAANNIEVALLAFAGGALLGLFTLHILVVNGVLLGLVAAFCIHEGAVMPLGTFIAAHGILEISVIILAGGAGLAIGHAWICPGERPRLQVVVERARHAVVIAVGCGVVLVIAAAVERLVSPSDLPPWVKLALGIVSGALLWLFLLSSGRRSASDQVALRPGYGP